MQVPPLRASTVHSLATVPGPSWDSAMKLRGGSHFLIVATESMPGPKLLVAVPPTRSSLVLGTNHDEMPGPVAMAAHTCSGVPGTSTSASTDRWPDESFFTGMAISPGCPSLGADVQRAKDDASARRRPLHRDTWQPVA